MEEVLCEFRDAVKIQGDLVRSMKSDPSFTEIDIKKAVAELKTRKKTLEAKEAELRASVNDDEITLDRSRMEDLLKRRFYIDQSFAIYGGVAGQYDFGPAGCAIKNAIVGLWRDHFVVAEQMLEVECSRLTPEHVLTASGHVAKFADIMVRDLKTGDCFRLDHLISEYLVKLQRDTQTDPDVRARCVRLLDQLDNMSKTEMAALLTEFDMKSPANNELSEPIDFNLMFDTSIGPTGTTKAYLRPETAQGIFVNFKRLLEFNQRRLPFAAAQIGNAFRNEISPRAGLLRVREFTMAEIEHFCYPDDKTHSKFESVANTEVALLSSAAQMGGQSIVRLKLGDAVHEGMINNETLGYYIGRIYAFAVDVLGLDAKRVRFRQHMPCEMAHYASDCWDLECLTSYGWIECVGCADRSAFDLRQHSIATGVNLVAERQLKKPVEKEFAELIPDKAAIAKTFKGDTKAIIGALSSASEEMVADIERLLFQQKDGSEYRLVVNKMLTVTLTPPMIKAVKRTTKMVHAEEVVPHVVEPSFGIGRLMYVLFEHTFRVRDDDEQRTYFALWPAVAPIKCCILPLSGSDKFTPLINRLTSDLRKANVMFRVDNSSTSIGRRYTRNDELAIPFAVCVDFDSIAESQSMDDPTVTIRERDTMLQVRIPVSSVAQCIVDLVNSRTTWADIQMIYPSFVQQQSSIAQ